jgi:hypothetical protein
MYKSTKVYTAILNVAVVLYVIIPGEWFFTPFTIVTAICFLGLISDAFRIDPKSTSIDTSKLKD